jgi:hypothetical protein
MEALGDPNVGWGFFDDFVWSGMAPATITTTIFAGPYNFFGSAGATITYDALAGGGIILTETDDNQSVSMTTEAHPFILNSAQGDFWFEARIKTSTITTAKQGWVCGIMDTTALSAAVPVTATGTLAAMNFVGFHHPEANTTAFDASYNVDGDAAVEVNSDIGTMAADTYFKVGMKFTTSNNILTFYVNGAAQASTVTLGAASGATFPDDIGMGPVLGQTLASNDTDTMTMDWWRVFQKAVRT